MTATLSSAQVKRLTRALDALAGVTDEDAFPSAAASATASVIPSDVVAYNEVVPGGGTRVAWFPADPPPPEDVEELLARCAPEHPLINHIIQTGDGSPRAISDFLTEEEFRRLDLYKLLFEPTGMADQLAIGLPAPRPLIIGIALNRDRRGWSDSDRLMASLMRPYLVQAHRTTRLAALLEATTEVALDDGAAVWLRPGGRVEPLGGEMPEHVPLDRLFPSGRLDAEVRAWVESEQGRDGSGGPLPPLTRNLVRTVRGARWILRHVATSTGPAIIIRSAVDPRAFGPSRLQALGLTERRAGILYELTQGRSNRQIADRMGVSVSGVKRHLEALYRHLGVTNRAEAAALAMDTLAHG